MIRVERNPAWWVELISHPAVAAALGHFTAGQVAEIVGRPNILPLAAEHGGFLFVTLDGFRRVLELHTAFKPEGWGREVYEAAREAFQQVFEAGAELVTTYEVGGNPRSSPPRSFGFRPVGEMRAAPIGEARLWMLTREAWAASPARRRMCH